MAAVFNTTDFGELKTEEFAVYLLNLALRKEEYCESGTPVPSSYEELLEGLNLGE